MARQLDPEAAEQVGRRASAEARHRLELARGDLILSFIMFYAVCGLFILEGCRQNPALKPVKKQFSKPVLQPEYAFNPKRPKKEE